MKERSFTKLYLGKPSRRARKETTMSQVEDKCTLIVSYNGVNGFSSGSHGNGRVVILQPSMKEFREDKSEGKESASFGFHFQTFNLIGRNIVDAYIYLGDFNSLEDVRFKMFQASLRSVMVQIKDKSKINLVCCDCNWQRKETFAQAEGFILIESECGGKDTLGRIVENILETIPEEELPSKEWKLEEEYIHPTTDSSSYDSFRMLASVGEVLFAGLSDGTVFHRKDGQWKETGLKLRQGVNVMVPDGESLLVGDGSCCSGATWRLDLNGQVMVIQPADGQGQKNGDVSCNVYGFARHNGNLLTGGGGCAGQHIYRLNEAGQWEYLPNDPGKYVTAMMTASDGFTYVAMGDGYVAMGDGCWSNEALYRYDGESFHCLGTIPGGVYAIYEYGGKIYVGSTYDGNVCPTTVSKGYIYILDGEQVKLVWEGAGGVKGFFIHENHLYAFGDSSVDSSTKILCLEADGKWEVVTKFPEPLAFFSHEGILYAGGRKKVGEKMRGVIYTVT